jgi:hypothetical protein
MFSLRFSARIFAQNLRIIIYTELYLSRDLMACVFILTRLHSPQALSHCVVTQPYSSQVLFHSELELAAA